MEEWFEANRRYWDLMTEAHTRPNAGLYDVESFLSGKSALGPIETAELGPVEGRRILHLQCHLGLDTLRLARQGAVATGLDISPKAIEYASDLAETASLGTHFVLGNLYDAPKLIEEKFDIVFVTWGALCWLPDIKGWADIVAHFLKPGGYLYLLEGHPVTLTLAEEENQLRPKYDYFNPGPVVEESDKSYSGDLLAEANCRSYAWDHPISSVVGALLANGLTIEFLHEHENIPWRHFSCMIEASPGQYALPPEHPRLPMAYSLKATKSGI